MRALIWIPRLFFVFGIAIAGASLLAAPFVVLPAHAQKTTAGQDRQLAEIGRLGQFMGQFSQIYQGYVAALSLLDPLTPLGQQVMAGRVTDDDARAKTRQILKSYDTAVAGLDRRVAALVAPKITVTKFRDAVTGGLAFVRDLQRFMAEFRTTSVETFDAALRGDGDAVKKAELNAVGKIRFLLIAENEFMSRQSLLIPARHPQEPFIGLLIAANKALIHLLGVAVSNDGNPDEAAIKSALARSNQELDTSENLFSRGAGYKIGLSRQVAAMRPKTPVEKKLVKILTGVLASYDTSFATEKKIRHKLRSAIRVFATLATAPEAFAQKWEQEFIEIQQLVNERLKIDQQRKFLIAKMSQK